MDTTSEGAEYLATKAPAENANNGTAADQTPDQVEVENHLGDPGKKALDAMKAERNQARAENSALRDEIAALRAKIEGTEKEHAAALQQRKFEEIAAAKANERILKAEIRAAAAGKLRDVEDALRFLIFDVVMFALKRGAIGMLLMGWGSAGRTWTAT